MTVIVDIMAYTNNGYIQVLMSDTDAIVIQRDSDTTHVFASIDIAMHHLPDSCRATKLRSTDDESSLLTRL